MYFKGRAALELDIDRPYFNLKWVTIYKLQFSPICVSGGFKRWRSTFRKMVIIQPGLKGRRKSFKLKGQAYLKVTWQACVITMGLTDSRYLKSEVLKRFESYEGFSFSCRKTVALMETWIWLQMEAASVPIGSPFSKIECCITARLIFDLMDLCLKMDTDRWKWFIHIFARLVTNTAKSFSNISRLWLYF